MSKNQIAKVQKVQDVSVLDTYSSEEKEILRTQICKDATDPEIKLFLIICQDAGLNPMAKQIYCIKRDGRMTIQTSIDGFRSMAARTNELAGIDEPVYDSEEQAHPKKATVTVYRMVGGQSRPFTASARWEEYKQEFYDKDAKRYELGKMWKRMPYLMLGKCAESLALRKAFPQQLSGIYTQEEMSQAEMVDQPLHANTIDASPVGQEPPVVTQPHASSGTILPSPKAPKEKIDEIEEMIKANAWEWEQVNSWVKLTCGQSIPLLGPVQANTIIAALKAKILAVPAKP